MIGHLYAPSFCRRAWVRFLRRQGCTHSEIATALRIPEIDVARMARFIR